jgi:hypothetical protein
MTGIIIAYYLFILAAIVFGFTLLARFVRAHEEIATRLADVASKLDNMADRRPPL